MKKFLMTVIAVLLFAACTNKKQEAVEAEETFEVEADFESYDDFEAEETFEVEVVE